MRQTILEALTYPRMVAISDIKLADCNRSGVFTELDKKCQDCLQAEECRWLTSMDAFNELVNQPVQYLFESLLFGIEYVEAHNLRAEHNVRRCICDSCVWVRNARHLARQYTKQSL